MQPTNLTHETFAICERLAFSVIRTNPELYNAVMTAQSVFLDQKGKKVPDWSEYLQIVDQIKRSSKGVYTNLAVQCISTELDLYYSLNANA